MHYRRDVIFGSGSQLQCDDAGGVEGDAVYLGAQQGVADPLEGQQRRHTTAQRVTLQDHVVSGVHVCEPPVLVAQMLIEPLGTRHHSAVCALLDLAAEVRQAVGHTQGAPKGQPDFLSVMVECGVVDGAEGARHPRRQRHITLTILLVLLHDRRGAAGVVEGFAPLTGLFDLGSVAGGVGVLEELDGALRQVGEDGVARQTRQLLEKLQLRKCLNGQAADLHCWRRVGRHAHADGPIQPVDVLGVLGQVAVDEGAARPGVRRLRQLLQRTEGHQGAAQLQWAHFREGHG
mmetsp:Transcript_16120/g.38513  ORF Transcript_16120/g.38513 Transcript_16120/m.38513 type:complete len:289 (+) Transcript_16120:844-1710(+)